MLLNYTNDNLNECIKKESVCIVNALSFAIKSKETLSMYSKQLSAEKSKEASALIKLFANSINYFKQLELRLESLKNEKSAEFNTKVSEYNSLYVAVFHQFFSLSSKFQSIMQDILKSSLDSLVENTASEEVETHASTPQHITTVQNDEPIEEIVESHSDVEDNDVLLISEKEKKVFLPYKKNNVQDILKNSNKYSNAADVVNSMYTVPLSKYNNSASARFREGFNLMRKKEAGSFIKSVDLGLELLPKYDLNPAVISACQNLDELDIYLDYLDSNELDKFNIFNVKYDVTPTVVKKQNDFI